MNDVRCTRCLNSRDREPSTFVEQFTDSAWCSWCLATWMVRFPGTPEPATDEEQDDGRPTTRTMRVG